MFNAFMEVLAHSFSVVRIFGIIWETIILNFRVGQAMSRDWYLDQTDDSE